MSKVNTESKRYNLVLPEILYEELRQEAETRGVPVVELLRKFIRIGLLAVRIQDEPGSALIIREGDSERQILIF
jgi:hypothetical protein